MFVDEILDYLDHEDLDNLSKVTGVVRMYKASYLDSCLSFSPNMYIECSYCSNIDKGKYRKGVYVCQPCLTKVISISLEH